MILLSLFSFGFPGMAHANWILVKTFGKYVGLQAIDRDLFHVILMSNKLMTNLDLS